MDVDLLKNQNLESDLYQDISELIQKAKSSVVQHINHEMVKTYMQIGEKIANAEGDRDYSEKYGKSIIKNLSTKLTQEFGSAYSARRLREIRQVYKCFNIRRMTSATSFEVQLSWSSYLLLSGIKDELKRDFYYAEALQNQWNYNELKRQYKSALFERYALSKNKEEIKTLALQGAVIEKPQDAIKSITVLEFLNLQEKSNYSETDLEQAIIDNLELFLLELGRGFTFVKRQYAIKDKDKTYHADLVFYNRLLRCFMIIDLKINQLTHGDVGQMMMYVNYFDQEVKEESEKPTIGLLLCLENDDFIVKYTIKEEDNIYTSEYKLILPNQKELELQIRESLKKIEDAEVASDDNDTLEK